MKKIRVLLLTTASHRSGAPMLMLHLIQFLRRQADFELAAVLATDGAMAAEIAAELPTEVFDRASGGPRIRRLLARLPGVGPLLQSVAAARCRRLVADWPPDVVYCNSAAAAGVLDALGPYPCPVVTHLHELEYVLQHISWVPGGVITPMRRHTTHYIAVSDAVRRNLMERHAVPAERITVVHAFIPTGDFRLPVNDAATSPGHALMTRAGVPAGAAVIGVVGTVEWRKGADLFVALARLLPPTDAAGRPIHLVWVGGGGDEEMARVKFEVATASLGDRVHVVGPTERAADWYPMFTVLALLSREDPFPLVCLEAAASGVPTVCFADAGGMPEFVEADAGVVVPFLDLPAFADALRRVIDDPAFRARLGETAAAKVCARHDVGVAVPQIMRLLHALGAASGDGGGRG